MVDTCSDDDEPHMKKMRLIEFLSEHIGLQGIGAIPEAQRLVVTEREKEHYPRITANTKGELVT